MDHYEKTARGLAGDSRPLASRRNLLRAGGVAAASLLAAQPATAVTLPGYPSTAGATAGGVSLPPATPEIARLALSVEHSALTDLRSRLSRTRFPESQTAPGWAQGAPIERVHSLLQYWQDHYDWRRLERRLNTLGQYRTLIDGLGIHFLHIRSHHPNALPLILTHGWPGSVVEFLDVIGPLTDPTAYGATADDAFHLVIPSLPGFGLSDRPHESGWDVGRTASAWVTLMSRLGYRRYLAQGGDIGAGVTIRMGVEQPPGLLGIHLNFQDYLFSPPVQETVTPPEQTALDQLTDFLTNDAGYFLEQGTSPQTIGYALTDSPAGQAAWIYEKFGAWTDSGHDPESVLSRDQMLDNITLYWLTGTAASSARMYWENRAPAPPSLNTVDLPVGVSVFPGEIIRTPRIWAERAYSNLVYFNDQIPVGGHFAAFEQPPRFAEEIRKFGRFFRNW
ncbi:epoxide hydrolase family protein [Streptomyces sp. NPDC026672]|uniref:epoxide hydrolase family protein n=1 Tax=unclassified Streptomyces TaxID=2593676 RepID=UPI0033C83B6F